MLTGNAKYPAGVVDASVGESSLHFHLQNGVNHVVDQFCNHVDLVSYLEVLGHLDFHWF